MKSSLSASRLRNPNMGCNGRSVAGGCALSEKASQPGLKSRTRKEAGNETKKAGKNRWQRRAVTAETGQKGTDKCAQVGDMEDGIRALLYQKLRMGIRSIEGSNPRGRNANQSIQERKIATESGVKHTMITLATPALEAFQL
ncbi:hypothetical protein K438DRAFT_1772688 [Mycena galopus ATCC 62051]|nr:hypothetical protein K438DRAFT_1772688 [Mycena galopus ATCC 62051]